MGPLFFKFKIHLGINGKMPKGYKELIHENTTTIPTSANMSNSKSPHTTTLETTFTHLNLGSFHNGGWQKSPWWSISPLHSLPKEVKTFVFEPNGTF